MSHIEAENDTGQIIRLAATDAEIRAAQKLRYRVFYEEMGATPTPEMLAERRFGSAIINCNPLLPFMTLLRKRLYGPLAASAFVHQPAAEPQPPTPIEKAYRKADRAFQEVIDLIAA